MPVAVNCCVRPLAILGAGGVTWIDTSVAAVTVSIAAGEATPLKLALMLVEPVPAEEARPFVVAALLMVATAEFVDDHVTDWVRSCVEPSVKTPVAVNCCVRPLAMLGLGGVTWSEASVAAVTVSVTPGEVIPLKVAPMLVEPMPPADASPNVPPALLIVATAGVDDDQVAACVRSCVELSV